MSPDRESDQETWRDMVRRYRDDDIIDDDQETVLIRFFSDKEVVMRQTMERISGEYERRSKDDGAESADRWLRDTATEMGQHDREDTRRMLSSLGLPAEPVL